jgi:hypothetical protein
MRGQNKMNNKWGYGKYNLTLGLGNLQLFCLLFTLHVWLPFCISGVLLIQSGRRADDSADRRHRTGAIGPIRRSGAACPRMTP